MDKEYKKTIIRMPLHLYERLQERASVLGVSVNSLMVIYIGEKLEEARKLDNMLQTDSIVQILKGLGSK